VLLHWHPWWFYAAKNINTDQLHLCSVKNIDHRKRVSSSPPPLKTAWDQSCFPFCCLTVCQNSSHNRVFASATTDAIPLLAIWKLPAASGYPWANQAWRASSFSLTVSFIAGVHQQVLRFPPYQAPMFRYRADMAHLFVVGMWSDLNCEGRCTLYVWARCTLHTGMRMSEINSCKQLARQWIKVQPGLA